MGRCIHISILKHCSCMYACKHAQTPKHPQADAHPRLDLQMGIPSMAHKQTDFIQRHACKFSCTHAHARSPATNMRYNRPKVIADGARGCVANLLCQLGNAPAKAYKRPSVEMLEADDFYSSALTCLLYC